MTRIYRQLQQELYVREQQFQDMKESKENEILALQQIIHDFEMQQSDFPDMDDISKLIYYCIERTVAQHKE